MREGDTITVWDRENKQGDQRQATLIRNVCRVGDRATWIARFPDGSDYYITIPEGEGVATIDAAY